MPAQSWPGRLGVSSEPGHHAASAFVDDIRAAQQPHEEDKRGQQSAAEPQPSPRQGAAVAGIARVLAPPAMDVAPDFTEVAEPRRAALIRLWVVERHRIMYAVPP